MSDQVQADASEQETPEQAPPTIQPPINPKPSTPATTAENDGREEEISKSDKIMIAATIVIALGTLVSAGAICFQWYEMHTGGKDTTRIADATETQVCAAQKSAQAARDFADSAESINSGIAEAVRESLHKFRCTT